jgi:hypothetical protein
VWWSTRSITIQPGIGVKQDDISKDDISKITNQTGLGYGISQVVESHREKKRGKTTKSKEYQKGGMSFVS